jgi:hypothetical protein
MGYAISWIAFKGTTAAQAAELLELTPSGEFDDSPEGMFSGAVFDKGWYVVLIDKYAHRFVGARNLRRVSATTAVVAATVEEHVMFSSAEEWRGGQQIWSVTHEGESGPHNLEESGSLPEQYPSIKQRLLAAQEEEDRNAPEVDHIFDVPLELAESIAGFKHDKAYETKFEILKPVAGGGILSRLFRKTNW